MARFSIAEVHQLEKSLAPIYDLVRFVDAKECKVLHFEEDGTVRREGRCFSTWGRTHRCRHCTSFCAERSQKKMEKDEVVGDKIYHVLSAPLEVEMPDKNVLRCAMELVTDYPRNFAAREIGERDVLQLLSRVKDAAHAGVLCFDAEDICIYANLEAYRLFHISAGDLELLRRFFATWLKDESWESPWENSMSWMQEFFFEEEFLHP